MPVLSSHKASANLPTTCRSQVSVVFVRSHTTNLTFHRCRFVKPACFDESSIPPHAPSENVNASLRSYPRCKHEKKTISSKTTNTSMLYFTLLLRVWSCVNLLFAEQSFSSTSLAHNSIQATSSSVSAKRMVCCRSTYVRLRAYLSKHFTNRKPWHHVSCSPLIMQWLYANDSVSKIQSWPAWKRTICTSYCMYICIISIDHVFIITGIGRKRPTKRIESLFMFLPYAWLWVGPRDGTQILRQAPISPEF